MAGKPEFSADVVVANEYTLHSSNSVYNTIDVGIAAVEVKAGAAALVDRTTVSLQADPNNTGALYLGLDNTVSTLKWFMCLMPGMGIELRVSTSNPPTFYVISNAAGQKAGIVEGKV
jgi:hypothetical protein